jgi:hypothetical protein
VAIDAVRRRSRRKKGGWSACQVSESHPPPRGVSITALLRGQFGQKSTSGIQIDDCHRPSSASTCRLITRRSRVQMWPPLPEENPGTAWVSCVLTDPVLRWRSGHLDTDHAPGGHRVRLKPRSPIQMTAPLRWRRVGLAALPVSTAVRRSSGGLPQFNGPVTTGALMNLPETILVRLLR